MEAILAPNDPLNYLDSGLGMLAGGLSSYHSPMHAVWCCVKPEGHLQVKPPIVLTHRN